MALWAPEVEVVPRRILWPPVLDKDWRTQVYVVNPFGSPLVVEGVDVTCGCLSVVEGREMVVPPHAAKPVTVGGRGRPSPSGERMWVRWRHGDERGVVVAAFVGAGRAGTAGILARPTPR